jgi:hypothetical protein
MENKFYNNDVELLEKLKLTLQMSIVNMQEDIKLIDEELDRQERESTGDNK